MEANEYIRTRTSPQNFQTQNIQGFPEQSTTSDNILQSTKNFEFNAPPLANADINYMNGPTLENFQNYNLSIHQESEPINEIKQNLRPINNILYESIEPVVDNNSIINPQPKNPEINDYSSPLYQTETQEINPPLDEDDDFNQITQGINKTNQPYFQNTQNFNQLKENTPDVVQYVSQPQEINLNSINQAQNINNNILTYNAQIEAPSYLPTKVSLPTQILETGIQYKDATPSINYNTTINEVKQEIIPVNPTHISMVPHVIPPPIIKKPEPIIVKVPKIQKVIVPKIQKVYIPSPNKVYVNRPSIQIPISSPMPVQIPVSSSFKAPISSQTIQTIPSQITVQTPPSTIQLSIPSPIPVTTQTASIQQTVPLPIQLPVAAQPPTPVMHLPIPYSIATNVSTSSAGNVIPVQQSIPYNTFSQAIPYGTFSQAPLTNNSIPTNMGITQVAQIPQFPYSQHSYDSSYKRNVIVPNYGMNRPGIFNSLSYSSKLNRNASYYSGFGGRNNRMEYPLQYNSRTYFARKL